MVPDFFKMVPDLPQKLGAAGPAGPHCFDSIRKHCAGAVFSHNALEVTAQACSVATVRPSHARPCTLHWFLALRCPWFLRTHRRRNHGQHNTNNSTHTNAETTDTNTTAHTQTQKPQTRQCQKPMQSIGSRMAWAMSFWTYKSFNS